MKLRGLYAITDSQLLAGKFLSYVEAALEGGVTLLQYRDKSSDEARRLREAEALRNLCERYKTQLIINDDAELAARLNVGVHLGQTDGPLIADPRPARLQSDHRFDLPRATRTGRTSRQRRRELCRLRPLLQFQHQTRRAELQPRSARRGQAHAASAGLRDWRHHPRQRRAAGGPRCRPAGGGPRLVRCPKHCRSDPPRPRLQRTSENLI